MLERSHLPTVCLFLSRLFALTNPCLLSSSGGFSCLCSRLTLPAAASLRSAIRGTPPSLFPQEKQRICTLKQAWTACSLFFCCPKCPCQAVRMTRRQIVASLETSLLRQVNLRKKSFFAFLTRERPVYDAFFPQILAYVKKKL